MEQSFLGEFRLESLRTSLTTRWFAEGYDRFSPADDAGFRRALAESAVSSDDSDLEILGFIGIWCLDCQQHLPGFARILKAVGFPVAQSHFYGLDRSKAFPGGAKRLARHAVVKLPTFIFLRAGAELGRITETPEQSLMEDWAKILARR